VDVLERSTEETHLVITCTLTVPDQVIPTHALIDCRATGISFMDQDFPGNHQIPLEEFKNKIQVEAINGRPIKSLDITYIAQVCLKIQDPGDQLQMLITKSGYCSIVLGIPYQQFHDVAVCFASNSVTFGFQYGITHCHDVPVTVSGE
jgi:hypothetical protein